MEEITSTMEIDYDNYDEPLYVDEVASSHEEENELADSHEEDNKVVGSHEATQKVVDTNIFLNRVLPQQHPMQVYENQP